MYTEKERHDFFHFVISCVKKSEYLLGTYLIGSASIGFRDVYSDCDFMMAYNNKARVQDVRDEILSFFKHKDIGYIMERKWSDEIWGISIYFKNGISSDISFGPLNKLKVSSNQISVGCDTSYMLRNHLEEAVKTFKTNEKRVVTEKVNWEFMYLMRKFKIAIKRKNYIYAYQLLSDARLIVMKLEGTIEGKKMHEFKAFNELETLFLNKIEKTIPKSLDSADLKNCAEKLLLIYYEAILKSNIEFDESSKYLLEIAD